MIYDIIVIGAGSGGLNIAMFMNKAGFKTLLIDKSDKSIGGDCLNHGCVPSKALIHVARLAKSAHALKQFGATTSGKINLDKVMQSVRNKQDLIREHENATYFQKLGIDIVLGTAKFNAHNEVIVNNKTFQGKKIVIATGSSPRKLRAKGVEKIKYYTNETIFSMKNLPKNLLVIGGGPIGMELGQAFGHLGSNVTFLIRGDKFLPKEDPEIADVLRVQMEKEGVNFLFNTNVDEFISKNAVKIDKNGKKKKLLFDEVFVGIGRVLNLDLDLKKGGIEVDERGKLIVDEFLRTTNKNVFVVGDAAGSFQFTHAAELHAGVILGNFFKPRVFWKKVSYDHLSWVTFTTPEIATFGLNESRLKDAKLSYEKLEMDFSEDDRSITDDATHGRMQIFVSKGKLLGGSMVANNAGELFQELVLANSAGLKTSALFNKIYPYPTASRVNKRIIQLSYAGKLTPFVKKILRWMY